MIKVLLNGTPIYKLCFARRPYSHLKSKNGNKTPLYETDAIIYMIDAKQGEPAVAKASSRQHHKDSYNPEAARQAAMKALLRPAGAFARIERTAIWNAYRNRPRTNTPKKTPPASAAPQAPIAQLKVEGHHVVNRVINFPERTLRMSA